MKQTIYCLTCVLLLIACSNENKKEDLTSDNSAQSDKQTVALNEQQCKAASVEVGVPSLENTSGTIVLQGFVDVPPQSTVNLSFPLGGYIKSTSMIPGQQIKKGEALAVIEDMQFIQLQQDYLTAKTNLKLMEAELERQQKLNVNKATSDRVFQQAKADVDRQTILISSLSEKLKLLGMDPDHLNASNVRRGVAIASPINGFVSSVNVNAGKYTSPTDVLFELIDPSDIHLALNVFEKDLSKIAVGEKVSAYANSNPGKRFNAKVFLISRTFNENNMVEIHCHFDKYDPSLIPGMFMNAEVDVEGVEALVVPEDAVVRWENKFFVFVESASGLFRMAEVTPGAVKAGKLQIVGQGISIDTKLVVRNAYTLLMKIKNTEEED